MRRLTAGVDGDGRSYLAEEVRLEPAPSTAGFAVNLALVHATTESPPPARPQGRDRRQQTELAPGIVRWLVVEHPPTHGGPLPAAAAHPLHHADVLDLVFIHEGQGNLELQDGMHPVSAGDCIVVPGVDHAFRPGPDGCRMSVVAVGTTPPG